MFNLRKNIAKNIAASSAFCLIISIILAKLSGVATLLDGGVFWLLALVVGVGAFSGWQAIAKIKNDIMQTVTQPFSYVRVKRGTQECGTNIDWATIDDYAAQLAMRGFRPLGDYSIHPARPEVSGVAACFLNAATTIMIEVQHIHMSNRLIAKTKTNLNGMHFSISSVIGRCIRVTSTDHIVGAANYLIRGKHNVLASHPGMGLMALLEKHENLLDTLYMRTGKTASRGLNLDRHVLIQRESFRQAHDRLEKMNGYCIASKLDAFEANPKTNWSPSAAHLMALPEGRLEDIDGSANDQDPPAIIGAPGSSLTKDQITALSRTTTTTQAADDPQTNALRQRVASGANWFYWIAALSLINVIISALGSQWNFALGLGVSQLLTELAQQLQGANGSLLTSLATYAAGLAACAFFAGCGWLARRPSDMAFIVGISVFALDGLIFLLIADWVGLGFHIFALFYLWNGFGAARELRPHCQPYRA